MRLVLLALLVAAAWLPRPAAAATGQPLAIFLHSAGARTQLLPTYDNVLPIAVRVGGDARRLETVTVTASGPDGDSISAPLVKGARGFIGDLHLSAPGTWRLALTTRVAGVPSALTAVSIAVASPLIAEPLASALLGLAAASLLCGLGLIVRPRLRRAAVATKRS